MDSDLGVEHGPERAVNGVTRRLADVSAARRDLGWEAERPGSRTGCAPSSSGGGRSARSSRPAARVSREPREPHQRHEAVAGRRGGRGGHRGRSSRAGWPRARASPRSRRPSPSGWRRRHAVATSSCTTALHLALVVAGVAPGDDVVVPSFSFIATANAAVYVGARPVFADVDAETGNLTADTVEAALTDAHPRRRRRRPGRGARATSTPSAAVCDPRGIVVVEDAACGAGSTYRGRPVGARGRGHGLVLPPPQDPHHGRGRDAHDLARGLGRPGPAPARARDERVGRRAPPLACSPRPRATPRSASTTG